MVLGFIKNKAKKTMKGNANNTSKSDFGNNYSIV